MIWYDTHLVDKVIMTSEVDEGDTVDNLLVEILDSVWGFLDIDELHDRDNRDNDDYDNDDDGSGGGDGIYISGSNLVTFKRNHEACKKLRFPEK